MLHQRPISYRHIYMSYTRLYDVDLLWICMGGRNYSYFFRRACFARCQQNKNGKDAREETEAKSGRE